MQILHVHEMNTSREAHCRDLPLDQVPEYVLKTAAAHEERVKRSQEQNKIIHTMGMSGMNEDWD